MKCVVTGCAGFIGSHVVDRLLERGHVVVGIDSFSTGRREFLSHASANRRFSLVETDLIQGQGLHEYFSSANVVFHFAANADVRWGTAHPRKDLEQNTLVTHNVLEAMRLADVRDIVFSSTGSVYGEARIVPTPEDCPFPIQTSLYGASKLASEALIAAYCEGFGFRGFIFRFASVLGDRYTHGHVVDFLAQLHENPGRLRVLGDGSQRKSYVHVSDLVDALLICLESAKKRVNIVNVGLGEILTVRQSIAWICEELGLSPQIEYGTSDRGWPGDNPLILLDTALLRSMGWHPRYNAKEALLHTIRSLWKN